MAILSFSSHSFALLSMSTLMQVKVNKYSTLISRSGHLLCVFGSEGKRQCVGNLGTHKLALETTIIKCRSTTARAMAGSAEGTSRQYIALVYGKLLLPPLVG